jgi:RNA polymerase sigma factor (TIGR02999 family)
MDNGRMEQLVQADRGAPPGGAGGRHPDQLLAACYEDMRRVARSIMASDGMRAKLQPTDLANEAALRLIKSMPGDVADKGHMLAIAGKTMRRVLIDEARRWGAAKRLQPAICTSFPGGGFREEVVEVEDLDRALEALERYSAEHARVVELRFSLGMTVEETARATGLPERTVKRRWQAARAWLYDYLSPGVGHTAS